MKISTNKYSILFIDLDIQKVPLELAFAAEGRAGLSPSHHKAIAELPPGYHICINELSQGYRQGDLPGANGHVTHSPARSESGPWMLDCAIPGADGRLSEPHSR